MDRIDEIRERLNKATPGPWEWQDDILCRDSPFALVLKPFYDDDTDEISTCILPNDEDFIAHAPDDIKYLLEQLTALQEENERLKSMNEKLLTDGNEMVKKLTTHNATLTKALNLACEEMATVVGMPYPENREYYIKKAKDAARSANSKEEEKG